MQLRTFNQYKYSLVFTFVLYAHLLHTVCFNFLFSKLYKFRTSSSFTRYSSSVKNNDKRWNEVLRSDTRTRNVGCRALHLAINV